MISDWKWRTFAFVPAAVASSMKDIFGSILVAGGSGETLDNERRLFDNAIAFYNYNNLIQRALKTPVMYGLNTAVKAGMLAALRQLINTLDQTRAGWIVVANTAFDAYQDGEHIANSFGLPVPAGRIVTWGGVLDWLAVEKGLVRVPEPELP